MKECDKRKSHISSKLHMIYQYLHILHSMQVTSIPFNFSFPEVNTPYPYVNVRKAAAL
jgi:hypothetical protein